MRSFPARRTATTALVVGSAAVVVGIAAVVAIVALGIGVGIGGGARTGAGTRPAHDGASAGMSTSSPTPTPAGSRSTTTGNAVVTLPPAHGRADYQLGGSYPPEPSVEIVVRDSSSSPVSGVYNICYVNAFQTQPGDAEFWTGQHPDLVLQSADGGPLVDPEWPDEYLLDTSSGSKRAAIAAIVNGWIDECAAKGFQAVEPDNLDSYSRSHGALTQADNIALATQLVRHAHESGLAIAQKNTPDLGSAAADTIGFDFAVAVAEECQVYNECGAYTDVYGTHVIEIEYADTPRAAFTAACAARGASISVLLRDRGVAPASSPAYRYETC
ncbi:endo alpha-1,4 polygalactosaminidase [Plantibacter sp. Mn2098]|uniref:endo alpha-1,4 polygalactosaminidase n=1 Tax=Plantibacter sp. Mn2098 TaxID=3395266 RepID=UPI003BD374C5